MSNAIENAVAPSEVRRTSDRETLLSEILAVESNAQLRLDQLNGLLSVDPDTLPSYKILRVAAPIILFGGYVVTHTITHIEGLPINTLPSIPPLVHGMLQAVHALSNNSADAPYLAYHLPYLFLEFSGITGAAGIWDALNKRGLASRAREAKQLLQSRIAEGVQEYKMPKGHTAIFEGKGDWIADALQKKRLTDVMRYATIPVESTVWQFFDPALGDEHLANSLRRADFQTAGEILLLPTMKQHLFLPDPVKHSDMSLDEMEDLIQYLDGESDSDKRVVIVGSGKFADTRIHTHLRNGVEDIKPYTLQDLVTELAQKRNAEVSLIDPTQLIMDKIFALANGHPLIFSSNSQGDAEYKLRFQAEVLEAQNKGTYVPAAGLDEVRVIYNVDDAPTRVQSQVGDIVIILDSKKREKLLERGIPEDHILCVPEIILQIVDQQVSDGFVK